MPPISVVIIIIAITITIIIVIFDTNSEHELYGRAHTHMASENCTRLGAHINEWERVTHTQRATIAIFQVNIVGVGVIHILNARAFAPRDTRNNLFHQPLNAKGVQRALSTLMCGFCFLDVEKCIHENWFDDLCVFMQFFPFVCAMRTP